MCAIIQKDYFDPHFIFSSDKVADLKSSSITSDKVGCA